MDMVLKNKKPKKPRNIFWTVWGKLYGASESPENSESNQDKKHGRAERNHLHSQAHGAKKAQVFCEWSIGGTRNSDYMPGKAINFGCETRSMPLNLCESYIK